MKSYIKNHFDFYWEIITEDKWITIGMPYISITKFPKADGVCINVNLIIGSVYWFSKSKEEVY